ncbi:uncharacterized protein FTOL_08165 [Fusarium torulosum]|uniref:Uncharacterized protein n=1 Tax=Fusarium torulosum TaxID=33205 RepID=A0AAE8MC76_9HYPO|nr:uncharacterized protein FTOL_08165 [Fusarium torulosum]
MQAIRNKFKGRFEPRRRTSRGQLPLRPGTSTRQLPLRLAVQIAHLFMIATFLCLSIPRLMIPDGPHFLYTAIGIYISAESLGLLAHELLTENVRSLRARGNERVYMILNIRGVIMWAAAAFLAAQGNLKLPNSTNLTLGQLALTIAIIIGLTTICLAVCYFQGGTMQKEPEIPLGSMPNDTQTQPPSGPVPDPSIHSDVPDQSVGLYNPFNSNPSPNPQSLDISSHWSHWSPSTKHEDEDHNDDGVSRDISLTHNRQRRITWPFP